MKLRRRKFLTLAGAAAVVPAFARFAHAEDYPTRPVRIIAGFAAGGGVDITARVPLASAVTPYNLRYLVTKRDRLGHQIQDLHDAERAGLTLSNRLNGHPAAPHPAGATDITRTAESA